MSPSLGFSEAWPQPTMTASTCASMPVGEAWAGEAGEAGEAWAGEAWARGARSAEAWRRPTHAASEVGGAR
eukprot:scaffold108254_cov33-Phaeocystis_antarctica.AAC.1